MSLVSIAVTIANARRLLRREPRREKRCALLLAYLKLKIMESMPWLFPKLRSSRVSILGFDLEFFDLPAVVALFEEMFVNKDYYFKAVSEHPLIIDAGSNIGISIMFFKWLYPASTVIAFEADDQTYRLLTRNIELNLMEDVQTHNVAVSDTEGTIDFYYLEARPGAHVNSTFKKNGTACKKATAQLLSKYLDAEVDLLKLDIEGGETAVLKDLARAGKLKCIREMIIEYHHHIDPQSDQFSEALSLLEQNGFGYQISGYQQRPFEREIKQFVLLYAYRK
jgi:FkbM family methyltransferase